MKTKLACLALLAALAVPASAAWLSPSFAPTLPPPPNDASEAMQLVARKSERTEKKIREIQEEDSGISQQFWRIVSIDPRSCPKQEQFLTLAIVVEAGSIVLPLKAKFNRTRPDKVNPAVAPVIPVPWHAAYPSGHATQSNLLYRIFERWYPGRTAEFERAAFRIGDNREIAGLHYRSDSQAGRWLGGQIFAELLKSPEFVAGLEQPCRP